MNDFSGIINIYKEKGFTSHDVVNIIRKKFNNIKTGHTGTLDPDATGVLPICIGKATKIADYIQAGVKEYTATIILGKTTSTLDLSGQVISSVTPNVSKQQIIDCLNSFVGDICQVPPMFSAIKINGQKLYNLARQGVEIERKPRNIHIYKISINEFFSDFSFSFSVTCSKGTYIRTLCSDIGQKLGCGACMADLIRTKTGNFSLQNSIFLHQLDDFINKNDFSFIIPIQDVLSDYRKFYVSDSAHKFLYNGNKISLNYVINSNALLQNEKILIFDKYNLIGIYQVFDSYIKPLTMLLS